MALSEAKKAADKRHMDKLDNIMVRPYREEGAAIRAAAAAAGMSVQGYILCAVRAWMENERAGAIPSDASSAVSPGDMGDGNMPADSAAGQPISSTDEKSTPESGQIQLMLEEWVLWNSQGANETVDDLRARLKRSLNRSGTIEVIKRIMEGPDEKPGPS